MTVKEQALNLINDSLLKSRRESDMDWTEIKDKHPIMEHSSDILRRYGTAWKMLEDWGIVDFSNIKPTDDVIPAYRETTEITSNGQQKSDRLIEMSEENKKDEKYILESHGYDSNQWEIVNAKHSIYNVNAKGGITKTLYSSKITVKPKDNGGFNLDKLIEKLSVNIKPYKRNIKIDNGENLLEIFLTDMHFGVNSFDFYKDTLDEILELIESKKWHTIYIPIGSDLLHNNDSKGRTVNDTIIEKVDMEKAWEEAYDFYSYIYQHALDNCVNVVSHYICGNHDKDSAYGVVKALSKVYTEVEWDTSMINKKLFTWNDIAILALHGDKGTQRITKTIYKEYGRLIADKEVVEIHTGDKHHTKVDDLNGAIFRILPTKAQTDEWHSEHSFTGSSKCFHIFEYKEDRLKTIHHV